MLTLLCLTSYVAHILLLLHRNHDKRYVPHPAEMGPEEPGNPHSDRGEAAGAAGHTGMNNVRSVIMLMILTCVHRIIPNIKGLDV